MGSLTVCTHTCGKCRKPWSHHLIDQDVCGLPKKCLCPACDHVLAEAKGQGSLAGMPTPPEPWEQTLVEYAGQRPSYHRPRGEHERYERARSQHWYLVKLALRDGKPVPEKVRALYETPAEDPAETALQLTFLEV